MPAQYKGWDLAADGNVIACPVTAFQLTDAFGTAVLLRVEFLRQTDTGEIEQGAIQLALTPNAANQFASEIQRKAADILAQAAPPKGEHN